MSGTTSPLFRLELHPTARSQAVISSSLAKGTVVTSIPPIATVLIESEKGQRCDSCLRARTELHRCTGCRKYWYCDSTCQTIGWKAQHRHLCRRLQVYTNSSAYKGLSSSERLHSLLLAHLLAEHAEPLLSNFLKLESMPEDLSNPIATLLSLLPQKGYRHVIPQLPLDSTPIPDSLVTFLSSRFANNNFTIHSARMVVFAHGIFPLASRSFNHSCVPSAVPVYSVAQGSRYMKMEIRLIRGLQLGEEVTIPYTDPALPYSIRQRNLELTYNFTCECSHCQFPPPSSAPPLSPAELAIFERRLREYVLPFLGHNDSPSFELREEFFLMLHPSYLPSLAEVFSAASHNGPHDIAVEKGATLLAVYCLLYPPNYPMIGQCSRAGILRRLILLVSNSGLHALELAKTCWNAFVTDALAPGILGDMETYLAVAEQTFSVIFGDTAETGDEEEEPISEVKVLREILKAEGDVGLADT